MGQKFHCLLLKLSGEVLKKGDEAIAPENLSRVVERCQILKKAGLDLAIVIGGGNIFRGGRQTALSRAAADRIGMAATLVNALTLKTALENSRIPAELLSVPEISGISQYADEKNARQARRADKIVVYGGGTGLPFLTTDTAAVIRALEIGADILLKATQVDGVYDSDPKLNKKARRYRQLTFGEAMEKKLAIMDQTAFSLCQEYNLAVAVFDFYQKENFQKLANGEIPGTLLKS